MISCIVIAKNEEKMIEGCLTTLRFCDEIVVIDNNSTDNTVKIAQKYTDKIFENKTAGFSGLRNFGKEKATHDWILYVDADERVEENLKKEIIDAEKNSGIYAYAVPRKNIMFGKWVRHGGWYPDYQVRLFQKDKLIEWHGELHERPKVNGETGYLKNDIVHYTHRSISETLEKKLEWSSIEAGERLKANHPKITWPRILKVMTSEFINRYIIKSGWRDGTVGLITALDEAFSLFVIYTRLWEMQNKS